MVTPVLGVAPPATPDARRRLWLPWLVVAIVVATIYVTRQGGNRNTVQTNGRFHAPAGVQPTVPAPQMPKARRDVRGEGNPAWDALSDKQLTFLHIPKAGTSFANTLLLWACPELPGRMVVSGGNNLTKELPPSCTSRFRKGEIPNREMVGHLSLEGPVTDDELAGVFTMLRAPAARLLSAFKYTTNLRRRRVKHERNPLWNATEDVICYNLHHNTSHPLSKQRYKIFLALGMQVRLIAGAPFRRYDNGTVMPTLEFVEHDPPSPAMAEEACRRLRLFAFVGLTDFYQASICLFHAMLGGPTFDVEAANVRPTKHKSDDGIQSLDCNDTVDERVYQCATELFMSRLDQHPECKRHMPQQ